ncbi:MAG: SIMPL domain-containing protein [Proteobacteria bacterium]|nr:SIMPL domain-containing protein [Pseudomonadota bacterium]
MMIFRIVFLSLALMVAWTPAQAQGVAQSNGTLAIVPAEGEVTLVNDEARTTFMLEERDADKAAAASRVNQKMKQGMELLKREDPQAKLKSYGYYTYPIYPEDSVRANNKVRQPTSWRVGQYLEMKTLNLSSLPKTVAAAQKILALNGLQFGLSEAAIKKLDEQRIDAAYRNLTGRIAAIAKAMGRKPGDAVLESIDFEGSGAYAPAAGMVQGRMVLAREVEKPTQVEEPSFEPGDTTLHMRVVGKVRFK